MKRITFVDLTPQFIEKQYRGVARLLREGRKASRESESTGIGEGRSGGSDEGGGQIEDWEEKRERGTKG